MEPLGVSPAVGAYREAHDVDVRLVALVARAPRHEGPSWQLWGRDVLLGELAEGVVLLRPFALARIHPPSRLRPARSRPATTRKKNMNTVCYAKISLLFA